MVAAGESDHQILSADVLKSIQSTLEDASKHAMIPYLRDSAKLALDIHGIVEVDRPLLLDSMTNRHMTVCTR